LTLRRLAGVMAEPRMADLRNVYAPRTPRVAGFTAYDSVGRQGFTENRAPLRVVAE
jgi:UDPglucose 6-dehydrogenase